MQSVSLFDAVLVHYLVYLNFLILIMIVAYRALAEGLCIFCVDVSRRLIRICLSLVFVFGALCLMANYLHHAVDMAKVVDLANTEKGLLQQKIYMEKDKKANEKSIAEIDGWIKEMRESVADGKVDYAEYIQLTKHFTELNFVTKPIYQWFADHKSEQVESELKSMMVSMSAPINAKTGEPEAATNGKVPSASTHQENSETSGGSAQSEADAMDKLVGEALSKN